MSPDRVERALLEVIATPADVREIRVRLAAKRVQADSAVVAAALRRIRARGLVQRWILHGPPRRRTRRYELTWRGVMEVMARASRQRVAPKSAVVPLAERRRMAARIRQCSALSQAAARLRAAGEAAGSR